jgi:hypothetical protein
LNSDATAALDARRLSAARAVVRGVLSGLKGGEVDFAATRWRKKNEQCPQEYSDPVYLASYAVAGGIHASDLVGAVDMDAFESSIDLQTPFYHLVLIYSALSALSLQSHSDSDANRTTLMTEHLTQLHDQLKSRAASAAQRSLRDDAYRMTVVIRCLPVDADRLVREGF